MTTQLKDAKSTKTKAQEIWEHMSPGEKHGVHFGMFPSGVIQAAECEGYDGSKLCIALMECTE